MNKRVICVHYNTDVYGLLYKKQEDTIQMILPLAVIVIFSILSDGFHP